MIDNGAVTIRAMGRAIRTYDGGTLADLAIRFVQNDLEGLKLDDAELWVDCNADQHTQSLAGHTEACTTPVLRVKDGRGLNSQATHLDHCIIPLGHGDPLGDHLAPSDLRFLRGLHDRYLVSAR